MDSPLKLTTNEQNAMAMLCIVMGKIKYRFEIDGVAAVECFDELIDIVDRFPGVRFDQLYDKFHRTGANS